MRKIAPLFVLFGALSAFSQGTVTFLNNVAFQTPDPTGGNRLVYGGIFGGAGLTGTQYTAELYAGADANSLMPIAASLARLMPDTYLFLARPESNGERIRAQADLICQPACSKAARASASSL